MNQHEVVTSPPEGNDGLAAPGERQVTENCRHYFVPEPHPLHIPTGYDICLLCRTRVPARSKRQHEPVYAKPDNEYTGY